MASVFFSRALLIAGCFPALLRAEPASKCSADSFSLYVDIHKRVVNGTSDRIEDFVYGSFFGLGIPFQNQSLWVSIIHNETYFATSDFCDGVEASAACDAKSTGGSIRIDSDTTFQQMDEYQSTDAGNASSAVHGNDTMHIYTHFIQTDGAWQTELPDTPVTLLPKGSFNQTLHTPGHWGGTVGLGLESTLMQTLSSRQIIPSHSFSLFLGTGYPRAGGITNGSIIFGGYDSSRFTDPVTSYNMTSSPSGNPYQVTIQDITLDSLSRPPISLISEPFTAELSTQQYPLTLPSDVLEKFIANTGAIVDTTTDNFNDNSLLLPSLYGGTMTITLSTGLTITLPPEWIANASGITPISSIPSSNATSSSDALPILGAAYLSHIYLSSSPSTQTFHLAPAIQFPRFISNETWCAEDLSVPQPYAVTNKKIPWFQSSGFIGAVLGGVLGGGALTFLGIWMARWVIRKEKRERWFSSGLGGELEGREGGTAGHGSRRTRAKKRIVKFIPPPISVNGHQQRSTQHGFSFHRNNHSQTDQRTVESTAYYQNAPTTATTATFPPESSTTYPPKNWADDDSSDGNLDHYSFGDAIRDGDNGDKWPIIPIDGYNNSSRKATEQKRGMGRLRDLTKGFGRR